VIVSKKYRFILEASLRFSLRKNVHFGFIALLFAFSIRILGAGGEIEQSISLPKTVFIAGEPIYFETRWSNVGDQPIEVSIPSMYLTVGLGLRKPEDDAYSAISIYADEYSLSVGFRGPEPVVLNPGEYIHDDGVFPFFGAATNYAPGIYVLQSQSRLGSASNEVEITVLPHGDDNLFERFTDREVLEAIQGWGSRKGADKLKMIAESGENSVYFDIAKYYLKRVEDEIDRSKIAGNFYHSPSYKAVHSPEDLLVRLVSPPPVSTANEAGENAVGFLRENRRAEQTRDDDRGWQGIEKRN